jgi:hypothetical protein
MPFRLAKLTACRKVRGMYRRHRAKSSRYGHESAMPQAHLRYLHHAGAIPLSRMIATAGGEPKNSTKARATPALAAFTAKPAEYIT